MENTSKQLTDADKLGEIENFLQCLEKAEVFNSLKPSQFKIRKDRRMKIYIKLNKEQSDAYEALLGVFRTGGVSSSEDVARTLFLAGMETIYRKFQVEAKKIEAEMGDLEAEVSTDTPVVTVPGDGVEVDPED